MLTILLALLVFSLIVVFHELGHFLLAKKNGVGVTEFSVGMGPRLITLVKTNHGFTVRFLASQQYCESREDWQNHTWYSIKLFPLGGSCMMVGEDEVLEREDAFNRKGVWARISVIAAGPIFNFILAFVLSMIIIGNLGYDKPNIVSVEENMPMAESGMQAGDVITSINGTKIHLAREISAYTTFHPLSEEAVTITYDRNGSSNKVTLIPVYDSQTKSYRLGFTYMSGRTKTNALGVIKYSAYEVKYYISVTVQSLGQMIRGKVHKDDIAGPVGITKIISDGVQEAKPAGAVVVIMYMLNISILLSANLGVMNLLPLPALDGGRLVFLLIEAIRGKPIDQEKEGFVHFIGFAALMVLMVFVMFNDISNIIH